MPETSGAAPRREPRIVPLLAHWNPWLLAACLVLFYLPGDALGWTGAGVYFVALFTQLRHAFNYLCTRCARNTPLDGQGEAERRRRSLATLHWVADGWRGLAVGVGVLAAVVLPPLASLITGTHGWAGYFMIPVWLFWIVESYLYLRHRPVQPWCQWCHWDDGGDDEDSPVIPDPVAPSCER